ncbi:MAG: hypothetical protein ACI9BC_002925, partial [Crocinitomicaceae bacterium]
SRWAMVALAGFGSGYAFLCHAGSTIRLVQHLEQWLC